MLLFVAVLGPVLACVGADPASRRLNPKAGSVWWLLFLPWLLLWYLWGGGLRPQLGMNWAEEHHW